MALRINGNPTRYAAHQPNLSDPSTIYHVGMYVGMYIDAGNMIVAPHTGAVVRIQPMIRNDYIGAVRPTVAA